MRPFRCFTSRRHRRGRNVSVAPCTVSGLADTVHTLRLVVLGTHHKGAKGGLVTIDRLVVA
jgi:hypothetical protein